MKRARAGACDKARAPLDALDEAGGRALTFRDVRFAPGPGAKAGTHEAIELRNARVLGRPDAQD